MDTERKDFGTCELNDDSIVAGGYIKGTRMKLKLTKKTKTSFLHNTSKNELKKLGYLNFFSFIKKISNKVNQFN